MASFFQPSWKVLTYTHGVRGQDRGGACQLCKGPQLNVP
jgi:hypothetical protein